MEDDVVDWKVASSPVRYGAKGCHYNVSTVAYSDNLQLVVGKYIEPASPPSTDTVVAVEATLHRDDPRSRLDVLIHQSQEGIQVTLLTASITLYPSSTFSCDIARAVSPP
ncbi:MAG TPA: hypothetical protein VHV50_06880 [Actinomycetota bacterium]|nr:hypothetical protein [Actinomycetota bacterium]